MATDLFKRYYDNPAKQYIYAGITCPGASSSSDGSFTVDDDKLTITDPDGNTTVVDLSDLNVPVTSFDSSSTVLQPNSVTVIRGVTSGESRMTRGFGRIPECATSEKDWKYDAKVRFTVKYRRNGRVCIVPLSVSAGYPNDIEKSVNAALTAACVPVTVYFVDDYMMFVGNDNGFEYYVDGVNFALSDDTYMEDETVVPGERYRMLLTEMDGVYVPAVKYRNGAFRGLIIKPVYPKYNDSSISAVDRSVKLAFVKDRVFTYEELTANVPDIFRREITDVDIDWRTKEEFTAMKWRFPDDPVCGYCIPDDGTAEPFDEWGEIRPERPVDNDDWNDPLHPEPVNDDWYDAVNTTESSPAEVTVRVDRSEKSKKVMGLYGYATHVNDNDLWIPIGPLFVDVAAADGDYVRNLIPSVIVYNPNDYPIEMKVMSFI